MMRRMAELPEKHQPGVVVYRPVDADGASYRQLEQAGCRVHLIADRDDLDRGLTVSRPVHAVLAASLRGVRLDAERLAALHDLRLVAKYTIGVDDVDVEAATRLGILVTHCPTEANYGGVAEGTIALLLTALKKIAIRDRFVRAGHWRSEHLEGTYLGARDDGYRGIALGIVGFGRIGRRLAELIAPWRLTVLATDPYVDDTVFARHGAVRVGLDELLRRADVVTLHCNLTPETDGLIDRERLALMRPNALLINTARGRIVDVDAVCDALDAGRLGGAAFDVLPEEPPPKGARILATDDRVLLSPHMVAANRGGSLAAAIPWATDAVLDALSGRVPPRVCNERAIGLWRARFAGKSLLAA
jgi:D-3-phosphoglycerate dehydrogenase